MQFDIVLVEPARPENVGAVARAMKTMGFTSLRIVASEAHSQPAAHWVAHGATDILTSAEVFTSLELALADVDLTIATTARSRARFHYCYTPQQLNEQLTERQQWLQRAAVVFGREDSGLTNQELALADLLTGVPMVADYPSLNLGQAVMIYCYQLAQLLPAVPPMVAEPEAGQLQALRQRAVRLLAELDVADDQKLSDWVHQRLGVLEQRDVVMLHRLLHDIEKKLSR
ncbi:tRNA/rRNA methyltransferase [Serratia microhaemolytica]|uniref:tRNA/rRNA methyltransferase n=1 Tax=Serratia microhaemolytica TaxID=2675110 RepID=UPI000FDEB443|nr:tRNA/rRNA methyltransferase [Serratia microhaemolytica]